MKNLVLIAAMATIMVVGCGSEPVKQTPLTPQGTETILQETILEENVIEENIIEETWDSPNVKRWD